MGCSSVGWSSSLLWVCLGDFWGLWKWKGIAGVQRRTPRLLVEKFDATNRTGQYLVIHTD